MTEKCPYCGEDMISGRLCANQSASLEFNGDAPHFPEEIQSFRLLYSCSARPFYFAAIMIWRSVTSVTLPEILAWMLTLNPSTCCAIICPFVTVSPVFTIACAGAPICWLRRILTLDTGTTFSSIGASLSYFVSPKRAIRRSSGTLRYSLEGLTGTG